MSEEVKKPKDLGFEIVETKEERLQERKRYILAMEDRQVAIAEMERARQTCLLKDVAALDIESILVECAGMDDRSAGEMSEEIVQILDRYVTARIEKMSK